ncbi:hypothetical protein K7957_01475 [Sphingomonas yunnanensis]|uniref:hypothetical protein n=1 Tax=Sphingomonas yunnanensis TaxID=310400 RepID=UPI001CA6122F|nr:hypothetical protein [Sphingomonas yunnanensis]MBY9061602.1 hypothetical protein [Sphingomonas yunnanensis]
MTRRALALAGLLLAGCERAPSSAPHEQPAGAALERAADMAGLIVAPARERPVGVFATEAARLCLLPRRDGALSAGASVDYGAGQHCVARGVAHAGSALTMQWGKSCTVTLRYDRDALIVPATLPAGCDSRCSGRASLAGLRLERLSDSIAEASRTRGADGRLLCGDGAS